MCVQAAGDLPPVKGKKGFPAHKAKKGTGWTALENEVLRRAHQKHKGEEDKWVKVLEYFNRRDCENCRLRWEKSIKPGIKHQPWTQEEDKKVSISFISQLLHLLL